MTTQLSSGYSVEIDNLDQESWHRILSRFDDANIYQTWAYGSVRFRRCNISHMVVTRDREIVAAAQICIFKIPIVKAGFAYVRWGPLWRRRGLKNEVEDFRQIIGAMRREYVDCRGLFLRIIPNETEDDQNDLHSILEDFGFQWSESDYRTLYVSLGEPLEKIRMNLLKRWRNQLNKAERFGLTAIEGTSLELFDSVVQLYKEMLSRKKFVPGINIGEYRIMQASLPDNLKMWIILCLSEGKPIAGTIGSEMGNAGIGLIAATGALGLKLGGSYLVEWKMVEHLKNCGCRFYDQNGINPEKNPGGYVFKLGLNGKNGRDLKYLGTYDAFSGVMMRNALRLVDFARTSYKKWKHSNTLKT